MARTYEFYVQVTETVSFLPREHELHNFDPTRNVLFIIWRPDIIEIADFYFIVFEKSSKFYISPFVLTENTKHPCPGYRNTVLNSNQTKYMKYQLNIVTRKN